MTSFLLLGAVIGSVRRPALVLASAAFAFVVHQLVSKG